MIYSVLRTQSEMQTRKAMTHIWASHPQFLFKDGWYEVFGEFESQEQAHNVSRILKAIICASFNEKKIPKIQTFKQADL